VWSVGICMCLNSLFLYRFMSLNILIFLLQWLDLEALWSTSCLETKCICSNNENFVFVIILCFKFIKKLAYVCPVNIPYCGTIYELSFVSDDVNKTHLGFVVLVYSTSFRLRWSICSVLSNTISKTIIGWYFYHFENGPIKSNIEGNPYN